MPFAAELTASALFVAGATTSLHCALMCGAINAAQVGARGALPLGQALALVHGGRVLGYALLGLAAGALGARLALWLPDLLGGRVLQALAAIALVAAGLQQWRPTRPKNGLGSISCHAARGKMDPTLFSGARRARLFAQGLLWALMPCGILYTVLLLAALTASPLAGLVLLAAFGLGTLPLMGLSGALLGLAAQPRRARLLRHAAGATLIALGALGLLAIAWHDALPAWLCARA